MRYLVIVIIFIGIIACSTNNHNEEVGTKNHLGKYIYRDDNDVYHANSNCIKLRHGKDDEGHDIYAMYPMDTARFYI